ncbi:MAG: 4-hydroxythreonine-4-phosphate dehydrogenase PdxA [Candidatus Omnitrophica bacterium]|nr:4-hydroxythreonine-4-phosphate dehydrogenase PdxA [Candidatus Omnitrophota bacterium]
MNKKTQLPLIGITLGDPSGIGPEVVAKALAKPSIRRLARYALIGDDLLFRKYFPDRYSNFSFISASALKKSRIKMGTSNKYVATAALQYLDEAVRLLKSKDINALVTAPVAKESISKLGTHFQGHTEFLANHFNVKKFEMMFVCDEIRAIIVTRHIPLNAVSQAISADKIYSTLTLSQACFQKFFRIKKPSIAVCGLNPHAGEGGAIGKEEITQIIPAIKKARKKGINVTGPLAADTLFTPSCRKSFDLIIAMYHDQGLAPLKTLHMNKLVNLTIGLPFIRTCPAHGTAFDIAGKNKADPTSLIESIKLAARLSV